MKINRILRSVGSILIGGILLLFLFGCGAEKYRVDYVGGKDWFKGAKDTYRAGAEVTVWFDLIATDTDYSFYLDDERLNPSYSEKKGYEIRFTMPAHDVTLRVDSRNSMVYVPDDTTEEPTEAPSGTVPEKEVTLSFHSFDGGGPDYEAVIADPGILKCSRRREYSSPDHDQMDGAPFTVYLTFTGLAPGSTRVTVVEDSPIVGRSEYAYLAQVDADLSVTLTELSEDAAEEEP